MTALQISSTPSKTSRPPNYYARISVVLLLIITLPLLIFSFLSEAANEKDLNYSKSLDGTTQKADRSPNFLRIKAIGKLPLYNPTEDEVKFGDYVDTASHHDGFYSDPNGVTGSNADARDANRPVVDVITISTVSRMKQQRRQRESWASDEHFVRHVLLATEVNMDTSYFSGLNNGNDGGGSCSNLYVTCVASKINSSGSESSDRDRHRHRFLEHVELGNELQTENVTIAASDLGSDETNQMHNESSEFYTEDKALSKDQDDQTAETGKPTEALKSETFSEETHHQEVESLRAKDVGENDIQGESDTVTQRDHAAVEQGNKEKAEAEKNAENVGTEPNQADDNVEPDSVAKSYDIAVAPDDVEPLNDEEAYCMQRRIGFAMGASSRRYHKLVHATKMKDEHGSFESEMLHWKIFASKVLPEYLVVAFDTTFYNTEFLGGCMDKESSVYSPFVSSTSYAVSDGSKNTKDEHTFFYPQKHSGVVFNKSALEKWIRSIACFTNEDGSISSTLEYKKTAIPIVHDPKLDELESEFCSFISSEGMANTLLNTNSLDSLLLESLHLYRNLHGKNKLDFENLTFGIGELLSIYSSQMHRLCGTHSNDEKVPTAEEMLGYLVHKFKITSSGNIRGSVSAEQEATPQINEARIESSSGMGCVASSSLSECDKGTHVACLGSFD